MKRSFWEAVKDFFLSYVIFFCLCAFVVTCSFLIFFSGINLTDEQVRAAAPMTLVNVLLIAAIFLAFDKIRRKLTVERQVKRIKDALHKITGGDFALRLDMQGADGNFADIMESINTMAEELSGVETLRTDFIANVSHELKTPLSVIQNYGTLLQDSELPYEKRIEYAKAVTDSARRLADLISNILKLNKLENQQIYPKKERFDLGEQLCECLLMFENEWERKNIEIETDIEEELFIDSDRELMTLIWNNLFSNAIKFTSEGGKISLVLKSDGEFACVSVSDTGCGISKNVGEHIFEKFYQGDTSHACYGNGLGLALVKRVVDIVKGEISVESEVGQGSTFTVKIAKKHN